MAQAGLKARTALGTATLVIGANLPDVDVAAVGWSEVSGLEFRRGWTHGIPALLVLPVILTGLMIAWDRLMRHRRDGTARKAVEPRQLLLLSAVSVLSHPILDYMNTYGMRWLMPFRNVWFYGDALFIVDPWLWLVLAGGALLAWRRWRRRPQDEGAERPARVALALAASYIAVMLVLSLVGQRVVAGRIASAGLTPVKTMVSPVFANPFRRFVVVDVGRHYRLGTFHWLPVPALALEPDTVPKRFSDPAATAAAQTDAGQAFLRWARFPFFVVERGPSATIVHIGDARYTVDPADSWAAVSVRLPTMP